MEVKTMGTNRKLSSGNLIRVGIQDLGYTCN
jgi:hypothetical protein